MCVSSAALHEVCIITCTHSLNFILLNSIEKGQKLRTISKTE